MFWFVSSRRQYLSSAIIFVFLLHVGSCHGSLLKDLKWTRVEDAVLHNSKPDLNHQLADLLVLRDVDEDPLFEKAMKLINSVAGQSTCHQAATGQLLVTCKAVGNVIPADEGKHELMERAKSVYAVRLAVCETGEGRAAIPETCRPILSIPKQLTTEFEVVNSKYLPPCLEALMEEHYYWTSYSNSRQDATTLCQAVTVEATKLEALQSYQKLAELIPEFRNDLLASQAQLLEFMKQQEQKSREINNLQQRNHDDFSKQHRDRLSLLASTMQVAQEQVELVSAAVRDSLVHTTSNVDHTQEALGHIVAHFNNLRAMMDDTSKSVIRINADNVQKQAKEMARIHELAVFTTDALEEIRADALVMDINSIFSHLREEMNQLISLQSTQLSNVGQQLQFSEELSKTQQMNLAMANRLRDSSAHIATELDTADQVANRMVFRLQNVNVALERVEKASSILDTLFSIFALPRRLTQLLHVRLLGLFSLPTVWLYIAGLKNNSCLLIAIYVFIECFGSLMADHTDSIIDFSQKIKHWHINSCLWAFEAIKKDQIRLGLLVILLALCGAVLVFYKRHRNSDKDSSIVGPGVLHLREHDHVSRRLRTGKRYKPVADRFRRAATVC